jgi:ParB-like chromosome segregation protein Spo0J
MKIETVAVTSLRLDGSNARAHPERNLQAICESLERWGQQKPIVATKGGLVVAGNGTLIAARRLGWETVQVIRTDLTGRERRRYAVADNRTGELATWNEKLAAVLSDLKATSTDPAALGFTSRCIELVPHYCDVIVRRYYGLVGWDQAPADHRKRWEGGA